MIGDVSFRHSGVSFPAGVKAAGVAVLDIKTSLLIPQFFQLFSGQLPNDGREIFMAPSSSFFPTCVFPATSERPHDVPVLHESYHIPPRATFSSCFSFQRIPEFHPFRLFLLLFTFLLPHVCYPAAAKACMARNQAPALTMVK